MAKMFYTLDEAAKRLGVGADKVREMASSGQLQEFRDRDNLVFKVEQVDLLAGGDEDSSIPLASGSAGGSGLELSLEDSGGGSGALEIDDGGPKGKSGISIFDTEELEQADPSAVTRITETTQGELTLESVGSGSGLLDLTREADDTSLGADLVGDVYSGDKNQEETQGTSGLFESTPTAGDAGALAPAMAMMIAEPYDGAGSGWTGGLALGAMVALALSMATVLLAIVGLSGGMVIDFVRSSDGNGLWFVVGGAAVLMIIASVVGMVLGKRS